LNKKDLELLGIDWKKVIEVIDDAVRAMNANDFAQPVKPYLRYGDLSNRIIAMPAYLGGNFFASGIKWIASFPSNLNKGLPRAHSITILNEADTGVPKCIINTSVISAIRTAAVSGLVIKKFMLKKCFQGEVNIGIVGFGPIGRLHLSLITYLFSSLSFKIRLFDINEVDARFIPMYIRNNVEICNNWETAYDEADIFITCTVSKERYINKAPKKGSLQLNVSLRDYVIDLKKHMDIVVVDDWNEICRENTDIKHMNNAGLLNEEDVYSIGELVCNNLFSNLKNSDVIMFNPMGMAIFDIAVAKYYYDLAIESDIGVKLSD
jgi:N-[(2S)-2-amino-2-carboxyethyl]-L-glutamate dehydrogenase